MDGFDPATLSTDKPPTTTVSPSGAASGTNASESIAEESTKNSGMVLILATIYYSHICFL